MFIQIHTLTAYPAALLNRDDAGLAKRIPFGNATRLRVSSQCLKRHWRARLTADLPDIQDGLRTRNFFSRAVLPGLVDQGLSEERAKALCETLVANLIDGGTDGIDMKQPVLFGQREAEFLVRLALEANAEASSDKDAGERLKKLLTDKEQKKNLKAMSKSAAGLTAALFGRFVTSDILARVDAPVHVAHAFTVHAARTEMDYFTAVDDLNRDEETGAAHNNETELGAGLYYGYVAVDVPLLVSNLTGCEAGDWSKQDPSPTRRVLATLIRAITEQSPGAKLGSTAPYSRAECVLLEAGRQQPRTLANAWLRAQQAKNAPMRQAVEEMAGHLKRLDAMYGNTADARALSTTEDGAPFAPLAPQPLDVAIDTILTAALPAKC